MQTACTDLPLSRVAEQVPSSLSSLLQYTVYMYLVDPCSQGEACSVPNYHAVKTELHG